MSQSRAEYRAARSRKSLGRFVATLVVVAVVIIAVIVVGILVTKSPSYTAAETHLLAAIAATRVPWLVSVSLFLDWVFSPPIAIIVGLVSAGVVFTVSRSWVTMLHFAVLVLGTWLSSEVVKVIVHRPRPAANVADTLVPNPDPDSYPSGHVCFAIALGFAILVLVARSRVRVLVAILAIILSLVTSASRVYLAIHYPTDVVASIVFAAAAFIAIETLWQRYSARIFRLK